MDISLTGYTEPKMESFHSNASLISFTTSALNFLWFPICLPRCTPSLLTPHCYLTSCPVTFLLFYDPQFKEFSCYSQICLQAPPTGMEFQQLLLLKIFFPQDRQVSQSLTSFHFYKNNTSLRTYLPTLFMNAKTSPLIHLCFIFLHSTCDF